MKSLFVRIWLTVVAALLLLAVAASAITFTYQERERARNEAALAEHLEAWAELVQRYLPGPEIEDDKQAEALNEQSLRLHMPLALDDEGGRRIAVSESFRRIQGRPAARRAEAVLLSDGRTLWLVRQLPRKRPGRGPMPVLDMPPSIGDDGAPDGVGAYAPPPMPSWLTQMIGSQSKTQIAWMLALSFIAVAAGAYPVARRLTRRLEKLEHGVVAFGQGALHQRVAIDGSDEVASLAASFNRAAERIETLVRSHQSLLANASHELRSPLARMKMALAMLDDAAPAQRASLTREIHTNIGELDALVEEVLLASRLEAGASFDPRDGVDLLGVAAEECARVDAHAEGEALKVRGDERLLRRALRNLLDAQRYGGGDVAVVLATAGPAWAELRVNDRGPGVPEAERERIFEPFYRMPGHAEMSGGVGLGLSLVRQIAQRHGGSVRCEPGEGGGSSFVLTLPR